MTDFTTQILPATAAPNYHDVASMMELRASAAQDPAKNLRQVAEQFESIFISMMLKSARDAIPKGGLFDSSSIDTYQDMFDKQLSVELSTGSNGIGLADLIVKQLERNHAFNEGADDKNDVDQDRTEAAESSEQQDAAGVVLPGVEVRDA